MTPKKRKPANNFAIDCKTNEKKKGCCKCHMTSLSSFSYCIATLGLTTFIITTEVQQLFKYLSLPWPDGHVPELELNIFIGLLGGASALLPFFFCTSIFKIGNFANDGFRIGVHDSGCSKDPPPLPLPAGSLLKGAWRNGGPTAPFIHLIISQALIIARLVMEAAVTRAGFLPKDTVWSSELSFLLPQNDRITYLKRLESYSSNLNLSSTTPVAGNYEVSSTSIFSTSSSINHKLHLNESSLMMSSITPANGEDVWHIGEISWGPLTPHLINYLLAHLVYAGRYASVFWGTNKGMGLIIFMQLLLNAAQSILALNGFQVLYKIHVVNMSQRVLPLDEVFLVPFFASVGLYMASQSMILASGSVLYLYGHVKLEAFLNAEREKYHILNKHGHKAMWPYWPHCWSLTVLVLMTGTSSPLIYDWTIVYRSSLDSASLVATCGAVAHLFLWILFWMALTMKSNWSFKLRVQVSKTFVSNTHSIRLVNEVQLSQQAEDTDGPIMVIGSGKTYLLQEDSPKRALMRLVLTTLTEKKARGEEEEIYWLRPKAPSSDVGASWTDRRASPGAKHKVTFNDDAEQGSPRRHNGGIVIRSNNGMDDASDSDTSVDSNDGDYARLRAVSFPGPGPTKNNIIIQAREAPQGMETPASAHSNDALSIDAEFPAPPPELTNPAHYPPPPDSPPPPLPSSQRGTSSTPQASAYSSSALLSPQRNRVKNPMIKVVRGDFGDANGHLRDSGLITDCHDSSSTTSSVTPPDKKSDSGVHSQTSTGSSSGTHSKSGSSGSESCIPPPMPINCINVSTYTDHLPPPPPPPPASASGITRCSSVDELCSLPPIVPHHSTNPKSYSLQHGSLPPQEYNQTNHNSQPRQQYQQLQNDSQQYYSYQNQQVKNNNNINNQQNNNERVPQHQNSVPLNNHRESEVKTKVKIELVGGGYGFLPPAKFVASEPVYSDASTPVAIRRRSSISAVEPETPAYERLAASLTTFTEPPIPRAVLRGSSGLQQVLSSAIPGKAMTVGGQAYRNHRQVQLDARHATISGSALPKGFHQPAHIDTRYFSVSAAKHQGIRVHPTPEINSIFAPTQNYK